MQIPFIQEKWDSWDSFEFGWSREFLGSQETIAKIGRATVVPFLFITTFELLVNIFLFAAGESILVGTKIYAKIPPHILASMKSYMPAWMKRRK